MTDFDRKVRDFVDLVVQTEVQCTPSERAAALQAVLDEAGFYVYVGDLEPNAQFSEVVSGYDDIEALLWLHGLFLSLEKGSLLDSQQTVEQIADKMRRVQKRRSQEEGTDTTDHERLEATEQQVRVMPPTERPSIWVMIANLFRSG